MVSGSPTHTQAHSDINTTLPQRQRHRHRTKPHPQGNRTRRQPASRPQPAKRSPFQPSLVPAGLEARAVTLTPGPQGLVWTCEALHQHGGIQTCGAETQFAPATEHDLQRYVPPPYRLELAGRDPASAAGSPGLRTQTSRLRAEPGRGCGRAEHERRPRGENTKPPHRCPRPPPPSARSLLPPPPALGGPGRGPHFPRSSPERSAPGGGSVGSTEPVPGRQSTVPA